MSNTRKPKLQDLLLLLKIWMRQSLKDGIEPALMLAEYTLDRYYKGFAINKC